VEQVRPGCEVKEVSVWRGGVRCSVYGSDSLTSQSKRDSDEESDGITESSAEENEPAEGNATENFGDSSNGREARRERWRRKRRMKMNAGSWYLI
jgi:hypothetical protein